MKAGNSKRRFALATAVLGGATALLLATIVATGAAVGPSTLGPAKLYPATGPFLFRVAVGDLNRDGHQDIVVCSEGNDTVSILYGRKSGNGFKLPVDLPAGTDPFGVVIADLNRDKRPDIAVIDNVSSGAVSILLAKRHGGFRPRVGVPVGDIPEALAVADLNRDGNLDMVTANTAGNISVLLGRGGGTFKPHREFLTDHRPENLVVHDFTSDGKPDVAVLTDNNAGRGLLDLLKGNGHGGLGAPHSQPVHDRRSYGLVAAQLTADHRLDVAVTTCLNPGVGAVHIFQAKDNGFKPERSFPDAAGTCAYEPAAGDINGDGRTDVVTTLLEGADNGAISVLFGKKHGSLSKGHVFGAGGPSSTYSAAVADLNGDGRQDVVMPDHDNPQVAVVYGKRR